MLVLVNRLILLRRRKPLPLFSVAARASAAVELPAHARPQSACVSPRLLLLSSIARTRPHTTPPCACQVQAESIAVVRSWGTPLQYRDP